MSATHVPHVHDVIVVGAGAAGLAAAQSLAQSGRKPLVLEARSRTGGRIDTRHELGVAAPIELGAEFVHGRPPELIESAAQGAYALDASGGRPWRFQDGRLEPSSGWGGATDVIFERLYQVAAHEPDMTFQQFLDTHCAGPDLAAARKQALRYVQGYHAARADRIGIQGLVYGDEADDSVQADAYTYRVRGGYDQVLAWMERDVRGAGGSIHLGSAVTGVRWEPGAVALAVRHTTEDGAVRQETCHTRRVVITLPLGVLKQAPEAAGSVRFSPALSEKTAAMERLEMGGVVKVVLRFREPFWEADLRAALAHAGRRRAGPLGFLRTVDEPIPTWWTQAPTPSQHSPTLSGWTGGPRSDRLATLPDGALRDVALDVLGRVFGGRARVEAQLVSWHSHNWHDDPYARGAYSYVGVNGLAAQRTLAEPVADTLFFAGEATEWHGHFSTVHGAIATGRRAAREVMQGRGRAA